MRDPAAPHAAWRTESRAPRMANAALTRQLEVMTKTIAGMAGLMLAGAVAWAADPIRVRLVGPKGEGRGAVTLTDTPSGLLIRGELEDLPSGWHAIHLHQTGRCEPTFEAAGGHFAPSRKGHGFKDEQGPHAGDLPNFYVGEDGKARFEMFATGVTAARGKLSVFDADGTAIVVHAKPDDHTTDPAGASGDRIACGAITSPRGAR